MTGVIQLSSGWWACFVNGSWIDAASQTKEDAEKKLDEFMKKMES